MGTWDTIRSPLQQKTRRRLCSPAHSEPSPTDACPLDYATLPRHSNGACSVCSPTWWNIFFEIFMDDFSIYGDSFDQCLNHLELVLQRCKEKNLTLNWEKCHFMVRHGIILGHEIFRRGIEVDKAKVEVIATLPPPKSIKDIRSFLGHAGFYRRFIKDFSKIARPLTNLLAKDLPFDFNDECFKSWEKAIPTAPIISALDWAQPFEIMCDASDFAIGAVLGQRIDNREHVIYYSSRTLNDI